MLLRIFLFLACMAVVVLAAEDFYKVREAFPRVSTRRHNFLELYCLGEHIY